VRILWKDSALFPPERQPKSSIGFILRSLFGSRNQPTFNLWGLRCARAPPADPQRLFLASTHAFGRATAPQIAGGGGWGVLIRASSLPLHVFPLPFLRISEFRARCFFLPIPLYMSPTRPQSVQKIIFLFASMPCNPPCLAPTPPHEPDFFFPPLSRPSFSVPSSAGVGEIGLFQKICPVRVVWVATQGFIAAGISSAVPLMRFWALLNWATVF